MVVWVLLFSFRVWRGVMGIVIVWFYRCVVCMVWLELIVLVRFYGWFGVADWWVGVVAVVVGFVPWFRFCDCCLVAALFVVCGFWGCFSVVYWIVLFL